MYQSQTHSELEITDALVANLRDLQLMLLCEAYEYDGEDMMPEHDREVKYKNYGAFTIIPGLGTSSISGLVGDFGGVSINLISMMISMEGWTDFSKPGNHYGTPFTDATAGHQSFDPANCITVGPGLTNSVNSAIQEGVRFTAQQIMAIYSETIKTSVNNCLKHNPKIKDLGQPILDMSVDCMHSGIKFWLNSGWPSVSSPQDAAAACDRMPKTAKGKPAQGLIDRRTAEVAVCLGQQATGSAKRYTDAYYNPSPECIAACGG